MVSTQHASRKRICQALSQVAIYARWGRGFLEQLANGVVNLDFWQKRLKHPSNNLANDLAKYGNLAKILPHRAYMSTWERAWQILFLLACWALTTKIKSSPCLHAVYCLFCCQVRNNKLLEIELFFTWQIVLRIDKSQDLPNRIWPNSCKYMYVMSRFWLWLQWCCFQA